MKTEIRTQILDFLTPLPIMQSPDSRRAALLAAGLDAALQHLDLHGSPAQIAALMLDALEQFGSVRDEPAPVVFLRYAATTVGTDKQETITGWCQQILENSFEQAPRQQDKPWDVFVCHAKEDRKSALTLYHELRQSGLTPWMAYEDILPGQDWEYEIEQALTQSRYVLALLSSNAVSRKGFIQKELAHALDVLDGLPKSSIFLIPARLDECEPLDGRLQRLHWVDLFPDYDRGLKKILRVLKPEAVAAEPSRRKDTPKAENAVPKPPAAAPKAARKPKPVQTQQQPAEPPQATSAATAAGPIITLRSEPLGVSTGEFKEVFGLNDKRRPLKYIQNQYEDRGEVILDAATGLMWQKAGSSDDMRSAKSQDYIDSINRQAFAGYADWRLPTIPELMSLLESEKQSHGFYINPLFELPENEEYQWYWSADLVQIKGEDSRESAWYVNFYSGYVSWINFIYNLYVRAVRSWQ